MKKSYLTAGRTNGLRAFALFALAFLLCPFGLFAQSLLTVSGTVTDANQDPLPGVTVAVVGNTGLGTMTDLDGKFTLKNVPSDGTLRFSYIGMKTQEMPVAGKTSFAVTLMEDSELLDELVVVGFGSQRKADVTGAVTQVEMKDVLGDRPIVSASAALQGAIPGLMVSGGSNVAQTKTFNIRGTLSINGGSPLVLIDNVEGDINALNPNDIESITVLKDASSAAIYGARAAGGVILVTTKRPKGETKFQLNYSFNQGWETAISRPQQASLLDYIQAYKDAGLSQQYWAGDGDIDRWVELIGQYNSGTLEGVYENGIYQDQDNRVYYLKDGDPQGNALETGMITNHNISVSGGTEKLRFRLSGNYSYTDGPMYTTKDNYQRFVLNSFLSADITSWFTQEATIIYTNSKTTNLASQIANPYETKLISWYPDGYLSKDILGTAQDYLLDSPRNTLELAPTYPFVESIPRIQLKTIVTPLENWKINLEYTFNYYSSVSNGYTGVTTYANPQLGINTTPSDPTQDQYWYNTRETKYHALNLYSSYDFAIDRHRFGIMLGYNQEDSFSGAMSSSIKTQSVQTVPSMGGGTGDKLLNDTYSEYTIRGLFGRLTYNFDDRYLLTANARYDGSSKFPKLNRFGFFPSVSVGWRVANESFMDWSRDWLDDFKLRASYGSIGNQSIAPYGFVPQMTVGQYNVWLDNGDRVSVITSPGLVRANYTWERVSTLDLGFDLTAFSGRLNSSFSWYRRNTIGMLAPGAEIPAVIGAPAPEQNVADLRTDGWELSVNWRDAIGDFRYSVGLNLYDHMTEITKFDNKSGSLNQYYVGEKLGGIWGMRSDGYYTIDDFDLEQAKTGLFVLKEGIPTIQGVVVKPGDEKFVDLNGDGQINYGANTLDDKGDQELIGNNTSRYQFGANLSVGYKGFDLAVMLQGTALRDVWLGSKRALFPFQAGAQAPAFEPVYYNQLDYWKPISTDPSSPDFMVAQNPGASLFRIYNQLENAGSNSRVSDKYLQSGAYLRVKNVTLSYTLPQDWIKHIALNDARLYLSVENLATLTSLPKGYDPESLAWSFPFYRTWSFGASITF